jgi:uncharacterized protein
MISDNVLEPKLQALNRYIESRGSALVALSGGIDSTLLSLLTHRTLGSNAHALTVRSEFYITREASFVERFVEQFQVSHSFLEIHVLGDERLRSNPDNRCYHCKRLIFENLIRSAREQSLSAVFDGTNVDDLGEERPGIRALHELGIQSPFVEAGMGKQDILRCAASMGLASYIHPSNTCLATRIPVQTPLREEVLRKVEEAESFMHASGFDIVRVRYHEPDIARIEVSEEYIPRLLHAPFRTKLVSRLKKLGFRNVSVDLEGYPLSFPH